jgi:hypothetical protein
MKAEELRIGNLVFDKRNGVVCSVDGLQYSGRIVTEDKKYDDWKRVIDPEGIPLTEEWLIKFGFEKIKNDTYINNFEFRLMADDDRLHFDGIGGRGWISGKNKNLVVNTLCRGNYVCNAVEHVHQLQNLYFALTGEELTIKE